MQNWEMIEELKRSEEKFKTVADLTYDWEFWMDADNNLIYSSPSCERITGYTREEFFANPNLLSSIIIKEDHLIWNKHLISEGENKQEEIDVRIICKNGQVKWINHICYTLVDKDGKILGRRASNRDITERKKMDNFIVIQRDLNIDLMIVDNLADAYKIIFKYASKIEGIDCGWICLFNKEGGFELKESFELSEQSVKYIANNLIATKQYKHILKGNPIYKNTSELFDVNIETASNKNISIVASIPFKDENKTTGVINFGSSILIEFTKNLKNIIETFVFQAGSYLNRIIAEHELIESEEKYKNFFETDLTADIKSTVDGIILDCNPAFVKMFEFDSKEEALKTPISDIYFNKARYIDIIEELQKKKKLESVNRTLKTKKGNEIEVVENILGEFDENGRLVHINSFMFDITKIRLVENALIESERRYRELFERMQNGFALHEIILNKKGKPVDYKFLAVNPTFEKMTGLKAAKLIGKRALEVLPNTEKYWIDVYGRVALTGKPNTFENYSRELGKYYRVFSYSPEKMKFAVLIEDITETRKSEEKIKQLSAAVEQSPVSIIITDLTGRIEYVNAMFSKLTGYNKDEVLGKKTSILKSGYTTKTEYKKLWKTIISGKDWNGIFHNKKKNGELFWESANI
jgi:PAS domain S-box-containing protein